MSRLLGFILLLALAPSVWGESGQRIVSLAPHLTEIVFTAGAGSQLVGVSSHSDYPAEARRLPVISDNGKVNIEEVMRLQPDVVLAWKSGNRAEDLGKLRRLKMRVVETEARRIEDVAVLLRLVGRLAGTMKIAEGEASAYERKIASLQTRFAYRNEVKSFVEIWHSPLMTVNGEHLISSVLRTCGGRNVFAAATPLTPTVSKEQLLSSRIEVILSLAFADQDTLNEAWHTYRSLPAVQRGHVYAVDGAKLSRMTPRLADGAEQICSALERYRQLNAPQIGLLSR